MADQTIALELNIDTNAPDAIDKVQQKIQELQDKIASATEGTDEYNKSVQQLSQAQQIFDQLTEAAKSHNEEIQRGRDAFREFRQESRGMQGNLLGLKEQLDSGKISTAQFGQELTKLAAHRAEFREITEQMQLLDPTHQVAAFQQLGMKGGEALRGIGAAAAFASGSDEKLIATLFKVEAATEAIRGAVALEELWRKRAAAATFLQTEAQKILNIVTESWPIAMIIAGVTAIAAAIAIWTANEKELSEKQQKLIDSLKEEQKEIETTKGIVHDRYQNEIEYLTAIGADYEKIAKVKEQQRQADAQATKEAIQHQQAIIQAQITKNKIDAESSHILSDILEYTLAQVGIFTKASDARLEEAKKRKQALQEEEDELGKLKNTYDNLTKVKPAQEEKENADHYKKLSDERKKKNDQKLKEEKEHETEMLKQLEESQDAIERQNATFDADAKKEALEAHQAKIREMKENGADELAILNQEMLLEIKQAGTDQQKLFEIDRKYEKLRVDLNKKAEDQKTKDLQDAANERKKIQEAEFEFANQIQEGLSDLVQIMNLKSKQNTEAQKALALIKIGIDEAKAISSLIAASSENPANAATSGVAGAVQFATGMVQILAGIANAKQVLSGGSGSSVTSVPQYSAPSISGTQYNGNLSNPNQSGVQDYKYNVMGKVYVSQTDLNAAQQLATIQNLNRRKH